MYLRTIFVILVVVGPIAFGFPGGVPMSACGSLLPRHGRNTPMDGPAPYIVIVDAISYVPNQIVNVLLAGSSLWPFEGFMLQARNSASESIVGEFITTPNGTKVLECSGGPTTMTHASNDKRIWDVFSWRAPSDNVGDIYFTATMLRSFNKYWVDMRSSVISGPASADGDTVQGIIVGALG
ncbi:PREDICTED: putative ferric-chelate reductase 1 [Priapulus caudatus]|uniref:Ferric-chelate reductase 1 n=1 Tax=Priapulus caudatus TaxID=37621 RepID=A0ABM1E0J7_PRICU|nr:PREDICTED: putative ferric-chelate reductase 1 [Priapulus caudatus]